MQAPLFLRLCVASLLAACAADQGTAAASFSEAELVAAAPALPAEVEAGRRAGGGRLLDRLFTIDHRVPIDRGRWIHLRETFSLRAWLRSEHRALLMLPGPIVSGDIFQIDVEGYRGRDIIAREGAFAFSADFEGSGASSFPLDGRSPSLASQVDAMSQVVRYIRLIRGVPKVDVLGESWGGGVAAEVCADAVRVRSCGPRRPSTRSSIYRSSNQPQRACPVC